MDACRHFLAAAQFFGVASQASAEVLDFKAARLANDPAT